MGIKLYMGRKEPFANYPESKMLNTLDSFGLYEMEKRFFESLTAQNDITSIIKCNKKIIKTITQHPFRNKINHINFLNIESSLQTKNKGMKANICQTNNHDKLISNSLPFIKKISKNILRLKRLPKSLDNRHNHHVEIM